MLAILALTMMSFSLGADSYKILLGGKLLAEQFVHIQKAVPSLSLDASGKEMLTVQYSHCGGIGTQRILSIRNTDNDIIREWKFNEGSPVEVQVKEISDLAETGPLNLYYASAEMTHGRLLASLLLTGKPLSKKD